MNISYVLRGFTAAAMAATALTAIVSSANAGGFAVREQSALHQGASFAGAASGSDLSTMYWNPAGVTVTDGTNSAAHYSLILGQTDITVNDITTTNGQAGGVNGTPVPLVGPGGHPNGFNHGNESGNIASPALVGSTYANHQLSSMDSVYLGVSVNAPFGLTTQPANRDYAASFIGRTSKIFNLVGTPTVGVKVMPGVSVAAGLQIAYMDATFKFGPANSGNLGFRGDDYSVGWTLGVMLDPMPGTTIGLGFRSMVEYELEGRFFDNVTNSSFAAEATLETPEIITLSITQAVMENVRLLATFEWTNWSRFGTVPIVAKQGGQSTVATGLCAIGICTLPTNGTSVAGQPWATLEANWEDAWFLSLGAEADIGGGMTLRTGIAYEESPIQKAENRLTAVPDNNRIWLSGGLSWAISPAISIDTSYTHIFVEDGNIARDSILDNRVTVFGEAETSVDIISFGFSYKMGAEGDPLAGLF